MLECRLYTLHSIPVEIRASDKASDRNKVSGQEESKIQVSEPVSQKQMSSNILQPKYKESSQVALPEKIIIIELPQQTVLPLAVNQPTKDLLILQKDIPRITVKKMPAIHTITRKQQRQIAKMKERALQRRRANEFLKGNIPYVVPLDNRNF